LTDERLDRPYDDPTAQRRGRDHARDPPANPGGADSTAPTFTKASVILEEAGSPARDFDIINANANANANKGGIAAGARLHLVVTATDLESGVPATPATSTTALGIDSAVDPIAATGCATTGRPGSGPINIRGNISVTVTNGAQTPATSTSSVFTFDYVDVGRAH
jgi:hypothetical protein